MPGVPFTTMKGVSCEQYVASISTNRAMATLTCVHAAIEKYRIEFYIITDWSTTDKIVITPHMPILVCSLFSFLFSLSLSLLFSLSLSLFFSYFNST